jgi:hypothetical protein
MAHLQRLAGLLAQTLQPSQEEVQTATQSLREAEADHGFALELLAIADGEGVAAPGLRLVSGPSSKVEAANSTAGWLTWARPQAAALCLKNFVTRKHVWAALPLEVREALQQQLLPAVLRAGANGPIVK